MKVKVKFKINNIHDRNNLIIALVSAGYTVKVEEKEISNLTIYSVIVEIEDKEDILESFKGIKETE